MVDRFCQPFSNQASSNKGRFAHVGSRSLLGDLWIAFVQNALPFVDDFLPIDNLRSLSELAQHLSSLDSRRRARRSGTGQIKKA